MPQFPADKLDKLEQLSETEQAEAGAFMLFYDLVSQGRIGGSSGLCVNYEPGDAGGTPDKISIGLDSKSYPTGIASLDQVPKDKKYTLDNLKVLMKQIGRYLDSGCEPGKEAECKAGRKVSITGYADAKHYGSPGKNADAIETSIMKNISLAEKRASLFSQVINGEGFVSPDQVKAKGMASPIGEYLMEGVPVPERYNPGNKTFLKDNYRQNCPERRVTVIDVEFNAKKVETTTDKGSVSPTVKSASENFVKFSNFGATIQTVKAMDALKMKKIKDDKDADKIIDKLMELNGITNPEMISACKNMQTRTMLKEHFNKVNPGSDLWKEFATRSEQDLMRVTQLKNVTKTKAEYQQNLDVITYFKNMDSGFGGIDNLNKYPLLATSGQSTSLNDCFSAKSAMQAEFTKNPALRSEMCKPVKDFQGSDTEHIDINFHPKELSSGEPMHIGCQVCKTGFRYVPSKYKNPETGKEETQMLPVFVDREAKLSDVNKLNPELNTYRPVEPKEADDLVLNAKSMRDNLKLKIDEATKSSLTLKGEKKIEMKAYARFLMNLEKMTYGDKASGEKEVINGTKKFKMSDTEDPMFKQFLAISGVTPEAYQKNKRLIQLINNPIYGQVESRYMKAKLGLPGADNADIEKHEKVILPGIKARDVLTNWDGKGNDKDVNNMLFGSLKKPRYYLVDNCNCDSPDLLDQAVKKGKSISIDPVPYSKKKEQVGKNTCIVSIPVPPSCMVSPNEVAQNGKDEKPAEGRIKWMGLNGENMDKALSDMKTHFEGENKKIKISGCEGLSPMEVAQKVVDSAECSGDMELPQAEELDCKK